MRLVPDSFPDCRGRVEGGHREEERDLAEQADRHETGDAHALHEVAARLLGELVKAGEASEGEDGQPVQEPQIQANPERVRLGQLLNERVEARRKIDIGRTLWERVGGWRENVHHRRGDLHLAGRSAPCPSTLPQPDFREVQGGTSCGSIRLCYARIMTVPQDTMLCAGLGMAAHLIPAAEAKLGPTGTRLATVGFAVGWLPVTLALLIHWTDWSWWYWPPVHGNVPLSVGLGLLLEVGAWFVGLYATAGLSRATRLKALAVFGLIYAALLALPFPIYSYVGTAAEVAAKTAPRLWESTDLVIFLIGAGAWLGATFGGTIWKLRKT